MGDSHTFQLPEFRRPDLTAAVVCNSGAVLLMRCRGHIGLYYRFPEGAASDSGESLEVVCARKAIEEIQAAARELASQLGSDDLVDDKATLSISHEIGSHPYSGSKYHYYLATLNGKSPIFNPKFQPHVDPQRHKMGVWMPYEWVPCDTLSRIKLFPVEAAEICARFFGESVLQTPAK